jgi:hypothetical protein
MSAKSCKEKFVSGISTSNSLTHVGLPPHAWLVQARLQKARQLLKQGDQIAMVAQPLRNAKRSSRPCQPNLVKKSLFQAFLRVIL